MQQSRILQTRFVSTDLWQIFLWGMIFIWIFYITSFPIFFPFPHNIRLWYHFPENILVEYEAWFF